MESTVPVPYPGVTRSVTFFDGDADTQSVSVRLTVSSVVGAAGKTGWGGARAGPGRGQ